MRLQDSSIYSMERLADVLRGVEGLAALSGYGEPDPRVQGPAAVLATLSSTTREALRASTGTGSDQHPKRVAMELGRVANTYAISQRRLVEYVRRSLNGLPRLELVSATHNSPYELVFGLVTSIGAVTATASVVAWRLRDIFRRYNEIRTDIAQADVAVARSHAQVAAYEVIADTLSRNADAARWGGDVPDLARVNLVECVNALSAITSLTIEQAPGVEVTDEGVPPHPSLGSGGSAG